jgi:very-short-patch-repair endonuclease
MVASKQLDRALLARLLRWQHDVITRPQAFSCGMTEKALRHRTRPDGPWRTLLHGIYLAQTGSPGTDQRDMAALLYAGPGSVITGYAALRRFGFRVPDLRTVDVLVPLASGRRSTGFIRVVRTVRVPEFFCVSGKIRFAIAARAVADAVRGLPKLREVRALVAGSVQSGWCQIGDLMRELEEGSPRGSARLRQVLAEVADGVRSTVEAELRDLVIRAGLPRPMFNARLYAGKVLIAVADAWWPDAGVAVEVDSREWHLSAEQWEQTMRRHARMTAQGILVLHFTPKQIRTEPAQVVAAIRAALEAGRAGPSQVRTLPATA